MSRQYDAQGNLQDFDLSGVKRHDDGSIAFGWRRIPLSAFTAFDPNSRKSGADTDGGEGVGIGFGLIGGWSTTDPLDGLYWTCPLPRFGGEQVGTTVEKSFAVNILLVPRTEPGLSSDTNIGIGLLNEPSDSGTLDGIVLGMRFNSGSRRGNMTMLTDSTPAVSSQAGSSPLIRRAQGSFAKIGQGATAVLNAAGSGMFLETPNTFVTGGVGAPSTAFVTFGDGQPYVVLAAWRHATTAGTVTPSVDIYVGPSIPLIYPI